MKFLIPLMIVLLTACASKRPEFANKDVCFLLFNINTGTFERIINKGLCEERYPAASTFKVPLAVMAFDSKVLKDENSKLKWDGKKRFLNVWNKDHTASSWMKDSVVWFSQELTPKMGKAKIEDYLKNFDYGNLDMSGGITDAWLTPATLKISGFEQIHFLKNLWRGELKASSDSQLKTKNLLASELSPKGYRFSGKTGSGIGAKADLKLGWWIGYLETEKHNYAVVINFVDTKKVPERIYVGAEAKELAKKLLKEKELW